MRAVNVLEAELDGVRIQELNDFEFQSPLFTYWLPADNIIGISGGPLTSPSVADGFFIMLRPLSVGQHTLHFRGGFPGFVIDTTYHLNIVR